ncbi:MAG: (p)ppGpp synthetase [Peptoniphilus sp.]|nr:(p)ppGpp synthetase [Peptoniphilus sp.]MDD7363733.1 (p)ppGpp synthetase [Bacillota bacterium]MDY6044118.1 (p)ppGpp synthetase [Peptoniphilus sp.]
MEMDLFSFIDRAIKLLNIKYDHIMTLNHELENFFISEFGDKDNFLAVNSRIKSPNSLREKIIRNNLYMRYDSPLKMMFDMQDIVGLRIECRFTDDEVDIYRAILEKFYIPAGNGYYRSPNHKQIFLNLETSQPMLQKNGFGIYKIDGYIIDGGFKLKFELQIKSLVNVFWGEIDHKVLYKNFNYMLTEDFFKDIMHSIKDNLSMIDRQLKILYEHVNSMDSSTAINNHVQVKSLLSKIVHDIFIARVRKDLGFVVDLNDIADITVEYLDYKCRSVLKYDEGGNFIHLLNHINAIDQDAFDIGELVEFDQSPEFTTDFSARVGGAVYDVINREFNWSLFFKIIESIEQSNVRYDFEEFFKYVEVYLKRKIRDEIDMNGFTLKEYEELEGFVLDCFASNFEKDPSFENMTSSCFKLSRNTLSQFFRNINTFEEFEENKQRIERMLRSQF